MTKRTSGSRGKHGHLCKYLCYHTIAGRTHSSNPIRKGDGIGWASISAQNPHSTYHTAAVVSPIEQQCWHSWIALTLIIIYRVHTIHYRHNTAVIFIGCTSHTIFTNRLYQYSSNIRTKSQRAIIKGKKKRQHHDEYWYVFYSESIKQVWLRGL